MRTADRGAGTRGVIEYKMGREAVNRSDGEWLEEVRDKVEEQTSGDRVQMLRILGGEGEIGMVQRTGDGPSIAQPCRYMCILSMLCSVRYS